MAGEYNPTAESPLAMPYQPNQVADPKPATPSPFGGQPGYQFKPEAISHGGAIAGLMDNVLRGAVNGLAAKHAQSAMQLKKKSDDLNASYNQDAQRLYQMAQAGVDPKTPEYQSALSAVNGSWGALQDFRGNLLEQQNGGKKKAKGKKEDEQNPIQVLLNKNAPPGEHAAAAYTVSQKLGYAPVIGQIASLNTPQAQQQRATQATQAGTSQATAGAQKDQAELAQKITALTVKDKRTPEEDAQLDGLKKEYTDLSATLHPQKIPAGGLTRYRKDAKGNTLEYKIDGEGNEIPDTERPLSSAQAKGPVRAWSKSSNGKIFSMLLDPATNKMIPGTENYDIQPPASQVGRISTGYFHWTDADGNEHQQLETRTSAPVSQGGGGHPAPAPSAAPAAAPTAGGSPAPSITPTRRAKPQSATPAPTSAVGQTGSPGDRIIGHKGTPEEVKMRETADVLDGAAKDAVEVNKRASKGDPIANQSLIYLYVKTQIVGSGRMNNTEFQNAWNAGDIQTRYKNMFDRATKGVADAKYRQEMVDDIKGKARIAQGELKKYTSKSSKGTSDDAESERPSNVPANFIHFTASDKTEHWIDPSKLNAAKRIDPNLQVSP